MKARIGFAAITLFVLFMCIALTVTTVNGPKDLCTGFLMVVGWLCVIAMIRLNFTRSEQ